MFVEVLGTTASVNLGHIGKFPIVLVSSHTVQVSIQFMHRAKGVTLRPTPGPH